MVEEAVKVKCHNKRYMGIDQWGNTFHNLRHPRKDLLKKLGANSAKPMYVDTPGGGVKQVGYVVPVPGERGNEHWVNIYEVCDWKPAR